MSDQHRRNCGCGPSGSGPVASVYKHLEESGVPLAMGYVPFQRWDGLFSPERGLRFGTMFPELCKPFCGKGGKRW
ncbi:MAG: spore coat associated protein CotJA [Candidatus Choladocola sp.]|nr:spore coat associated protein CotJA [Candidatus Choladocola sp.]